MKCAWIDLSGYHAAINAMVEPNRTMADRDAAYKANPPVKCESAATHRVEMYGEDIHDDSQVHVCDEHVNEWKEDEFTAIYTL